MRATFNVLQYILVPRTDGRQKERKRRAGEGEGEDVTNSQRVAGFVSLSLITPLRPQWRDAIF